MKAAVCRSFQAPLSIEELDIGDPKQGEVKVRVKACAICHSDIMFMDGHWGGDLPAVFGHEAAGVVEEVGRDVNGFSAGDRVVITLIRSCGACHYCDRGDLVMCESSFRLDSESPISHPTRGLVHQGIQAGAFAEEVVIHESQIQKIPEALSFEPASLLSCGVITGFGAVTNTVTVPAGASVVVVGTGGVGLNCIQGAVYQQADPIIAVDVSDDKLEVAKSFGATLGVNASREDVKASVFQHTGGRGADYVFVSVGAKSAIDDCVGLLAKGGTGVIVGMPATGVMSEYDPSELASKSQRIIGSKMGSTRLVEDIPLLISLYQNGQLKLDELISGTYSLENINDAIASAKKGNALRNVVLL
ncbi:MAG: zinc-binding dehydrogenase [Pseudomonadota bacterium]